MSEDTVESEAPPPKPAKPKRRRTPVDWPVIIMISGTLVFLIVFGAITALVPRRPFLGVRFAQTNGRLTPTPMAAGVVPVVGTAPAGAPVPKP